MGDISTTNVELRQRRGVSPLVDRDNDFLSPNPTEEELADFRKSTSGDPLSTDLSNASSYRTLIATNTASGNIRLAKSESPDTVLFYVTNGSFKRNTPSVVIAHGDDKGPVLGTLKLGWGRDNTFGLGDPAKGDPITWENMKRTSEWTHATYEYNVGERHFVWQRTKQRIFSDQPNMELREIAVDGTKGEVLAVYTGNQGMMWTSRGQFSLSPTLHNDSKPAWEGANAGLWSELELMALLSGLGIIEASRRRSRARRSGGAAGAAGGG